MVSTVTSKQKSPGFEPWDDEGCLSVGSVHVIPVPVWVSSGYSSFLPQTGRLGQVAALNCMPV